jgi:hypothetical protein
VTSRKALLEGTHFRHIINHLRDPASFKLSPDLTEAQKAELAVEAQFYGLLRRVMPYYPEEQFGVALLKRACTAGTKPALLMALARARELVVKMGSTMPWLVDKFPATRYIVNDWVVNGAPVDTPVWALEDNNNRKYLNRANNGKIWRKSLTQRPRFTTDGGTCGAEWVGAAWVHVPDTLVVVVHGLDDGHPAMAAALRQLAALTDHV